jgi:DHA2 family multidrug resistance protein
VQHLTPFSRNLQAAVPQISEVLRERGFTFPLTGRGRLGVIYNELLRQASMLSFNDVFHILSIMMMLILPLVLLMKKGKEGTSGAGIH